MKWIRGANIFHAFENGSVKAAIDGYITSWPNLKCEVRCKISEIEDHLEDWDYNEILCLKPNWNLRFLKIELGNHDLKFHENN